MTRVEKNYHLTTFFKTTKYAFKIGFTILDKNGLFTSWASMMPTMDVRISRSGTQRMKRIIFRRERSHFQVDGSKRNFQARIFSLPQPDRRERINVPTSTTKRAGRSKTSVRRCKFDARRSGRLRSMK